MTLRHFGVGWCDYDLLLKGIGASTSETCHKWVEIFTSDDFNQFCTDNRGRKRGEGFYDLYPDTRVAAKSFSTERYARKSADCTVIDLASFVIEKYYELTNTVKDASSSLIRSEKSCRLDLRQSGARFNSNSKRSYFQGHERASYDIRRQ